MSGSEVADNSSPTVQAEQQISTCSEETTPSQQSIKSESVETKTAVVTSRDIVSVERLYELCETLDSVSKNSPDKMASFEGLFRELLTGVKGEKKQKQLSCQFIMRFFKYFVSCQEKSMLELTLDALFDLCEDDDAAIRRQAIKELPNVCREFTGTVARISDILAQLLQAEDTIEYAVVQSSLLSLVKIDPKQCLLALFEQILTASQTGGEVIRERTIKFLATKLPSLPPDILTPEIETLLIEKIQEALTDVSCQEFNTFIKILSSLKQMQQTEGRLRLVEVIASQAGISGDSKDDFDPRDAETATVLVQCTKQALDFFSRSVPSTKFTVFFCSTVLPRVWELPSKETSENPGAVTQIDVLKLLAELSTNSGTLEIDCIEHVYNALVRLLPERPKDDSKSASELPNLMLSHLECILFTFHTLAKQPAYMRCEQSRENLKKLRPTLVFLSSGIQSHIQKLRDDISDCSQEELKEKENSIKVTALKVTLNITLLIKDLVKSPPAFDTIVMLSWKRAPSSTSGKSNAGKRKSYHSDQHDQVRGEEGQRSSRGQQVYNPPSGKYSKQVLSYDSKYKPGYKGSSKKLGVYYA